MNNRTHIVIFTLLASVSDASACQYSGNAHEAKSALVDRQQMRVLARELADRSSRIFIGTLHKLSEEAAVFSDILELKGQTDEGFRVEWKRAPEIIVGCSGSADFESLTVPRLDPDGFIKRYLIYADNQILLRANEIESFALKPSGHEELEWLLDSASVANEAFEPLEVEE